MKVCNVCRTAKDSNAYYVNPVNSDGLAGTCKICANKRAADWRVANRSAANANSNAWRARNPDKVRNTWLLHEYGITLLQYRALETRQNGLCAICRRPETVLDRKTKEPRALAVDHDHATGKIRGLLCFACNVALGKISENFDTALNLAKYIQEHKDVV